MCTCFSTSNFLLLLCCSFLHASLSSYPYSLISFRLKCLDCRFFSFACILSLVSNADRFFSCISSMAPLFLCEHSAICKCSLVPSKQKKGVALEMMSSNDLSGTQYFEAFHICYSVSGYSSFQ